MYVILGSKRVVFYAGWMDYVEKGSVEFTGLFFIDYLINFFRINFGNDKIMKYLTLLRM